MSNTNYGTDGKLGVNVKQVDSTAVFGLGERVSGNEGAVYVYCQANGAISGDGYVCLLDESYQAVLIDTTNSATAFGDPVGVAKATFADNEYGWIQIAGTANVRVAASAAANTALNTTATAGEIDDDASVGAEVIDRIILGVARDGTPGLAEGYLTFPTVGATL